MLKKNTTFSRLWVQERGVFRFKLSFRGRGDRAEGAQQAGRK